jgi:uncharacterized alpha-E superfamily protein
MFWMARYLERAEHTARIVRVQLTLMVDRSAVPNADRWQRVIESLGKPKLPPNQDYLESFLYDRECAASVVSCVGRARENCRQVRNQISTEMWEQLNRLYYTSLGFSSEQFPDPMEFVRAVDEGVHLFEGITATTLSRNEGWQFIQIGKYLERTVNTAALLDVHFRDIASKHHMEWVGLLRSCTAFEAYCREYTVNLKPERILQFIMLDPEFPHALAYSCGAVQTALRSLPGTDSLGGNPARIAGRLHSALQYLQVEEIMADGVHKHLEDIRRGCFQIHSAFQEEYIDYPVDVELTG